MTAKKLSPTEAVILARLVLEEEGGVTVADPRDGDTRRSLEALIQHRYIDCRYTGDARELAMSATREGRLRILNPERL